MGGLSCTAKFCIVTFLLKQTNRSNPLIFISCKPKRAGKASVSNCKLCSMGFFDAAFLIACQVSGNWSSRSTRWYKGFGPPACPHWRSSDFSAAFARVVPPSRAVKRNFRTTSEMRDISNSLLLCSISIRHFETAPAPSKGKYRSSSNRNSNKPASSIPLLVALF